MASGTADLQRDLGGAIMQSIFGALLTAGYAAAAAAAEAVAMADRFRDPDLFSLAMHLQGMARIDGGRVDGGLAMLDGAMVPPTGGGVSPSRAGARLNSSKDSPGPSGSAIARRPEPSAQRSQQAWAMLNRSGISHRNARRHPS